MFSRASAFVCSCVSLVNVTYHLTIVYLRPWKMSGSGEQRNLLSLSETLYAFKTKITKTFSMTFSLTFSFLVADLFARAPHFFIYVLVHSRRNLGENLRNY